MGLQIKWDITYRCNLFCEHCLNGEFLDQRSKDLNFFDFQRIIDDIESHTKIEKISFLGGEPLVKNEFVDFCQYLNDSKVRFEFNTNGLALTGKTIDRLLQMEYFAGVVLSLEGPDRESNDSIRGKNVFEVVIKKIEKFIEKRNEKNHQSELTINTVLTSANKDRLVEMLDLLDKLKADSFVLLEFIEMGNGVGKSLAVSFEDTVNILGEIGRALKFRDYHVKFIPRLVKPVIIDYVNKRYNVELNYSSAGCGVSTSYVYLNNKGDMFPCERGRDYGMYSADSLLEKKFSGIWESQKYDDMFDLMSSEKLNDLEPCKTCKYFREMCFPCFIDVLHDNRKNIMNCKNSIRKLEEMKVNA